MTFLETQQSELQQLIEEITRALEGVSSFAQTTPLADSRGSLPQPVDEPVAHAFGATYGGAAAWCEKDCHTNRTRAIQSGPCTPVEWFLLTGCGDPGCWSCSIMGRAA